MCGIAAIFGKKIEQDKVLNILNIQHHRGPDAQKYYRSDCDHATLLHNRLSIIDLREEGNQPLTDSSGRFTIAFNGEIYNYIELRSELSSKWEFKTSTDTEVLLAGYSIYKEGILDKLIGMFAFVIWDNIDKKAFVARDRFGVKPLFYHINTENHLMMSSEIKAIHAMDIPKSPNHRAWSNYLTFGLYDHDEYTFWNGIKKLRPGCYMTWQDNKVEIKEWYNLSTRVKKEFDNRSMAEVTEEYNALLHDSIKLRFRADVPVGINLSGGLDSSTLLGLVQDYLGEESDVKAFTFTTGDENYDELPWVREIVETTNHPLIVSQLNSNEVPKLAKEVQYCQDEPFGGMPTLAYAKLFQTARENDVIVLLDGQGMDEQWAGYDYYRNIKNSSASVVQGTKESPVRVNCLNTDFVNLAQKTPFPRPFTDELRNIQYRDSFYTKIPRALRFNDRVSMRSSTELREPFLDHRLFELAFIQPQDFKIKGDQGKFFLRNLVEKLLPTKIANAPKRALQTPQREWLKEDLKDWANDLIVKACNDCPEWLVYDHVMKEWKNFLDGKSDNSFYVWQWITIGLMDIKNG